jgi:hypothetical protein
MKYIPTTKAILFSIFLVFIYWDSTLWKIALNSIGENQERVTYGLFCSMLFLLISIGYSSVFLFFRALSAKEKRRETPKDASILQYILIGIFCFKFLIFGDLGFNIDSYYETIDAIEIEKPNLVPESLQIYNVGQVKGGYGLYSIYQGFYVLKDLKTNKTYPVCSRVVSGNNLKQDIYAEYMNINPIFLVKNTTIKAEQKDEVRKFFDSLSYSYNTDIYDIKGKSGLVLFFMRLLYWAVFALVLVLCVFFVSLSLPD